jgi:hypothetical protein
MRAPVISTDEALEALKVAVNLGSDINAVEKKGERRCTVQATTTFSV